GALPHEDQARPAQLMGATSPVQYREFWVDHSFSDSRQPAEHIRVFYLQSIILDLATRWWWSEDGTHLTFALRDGVTWHKWDSRNSPQARQLKLEQPGGPRCFDGTSCADDDGEIWWGWGYASRTNYLGKKTSSTPFAAPSSRPTGSNRFGRID